jgi:hypothetical protein
MKNVLSDGITTSSQQPYTKTTHEWYNAMSKDVAEAFVKSLIPSSAYTGKLVILNGCILTGTNPGIRTISDGWVWYDGEIFRVNSGTFTTGSGEIGIWSINTVATNLTFSDNASKPVHQERTFVITNGTSGSGLFDEEDLIRLTVIPSGGSSYAFYGSTDTNNDNAISFGVWDCAVRLGFESVNNNIGLGYNDSALSGVFTDSQPTNVEWNPSSDEYPAYTHYKIKGKGLYNVSVSFSVKNTSAFSGNYTMQIMNNTTAYIAGTGEVVTTGAIPIDIAETNITSLNLIRRSLDVGDILWVKCTNNDVDISLQIQDCSLVIESV